jgi:mono/diheme cytochrome c family protein
MRFLILALSVAASPAIAQDMARGQELFRGHCAACHGLNAEGDGPMTSILDIAPPDLTAIAAGNGGVFPMARVVRSVDGRDIMLSHGGPMPLFGMILEGESAVVDGEDGAPIITRKPVVDIAAFLAGIQR